MLTRSQRRQAGLSLIELMISLVISLIVVLGATNLYLAIVESSMSTYERNRLTEEMGALGTVIARDVRRAGYWAADMGTDAVWNNPFTVTGTTDLLIGEMSGAPTDSCVFYSYDVDRDGLVDANEYYAARLNGSSIEVATDASDCNTGTFNAITSPELEVTTFSFSLSEACLDVTTEAVESCPCASGDSCQHVRSLDFTLSGNLAISPEKTETLIETIKIRNDKFVLSVP